MIVTRPYNAEDNDINIEMRNILDRFTRKNNETIIELEIYGAAVTAKTNKGNEYQMNKAEGCRLGTSYAQRNYFYMNQLIDNKRVRIKKEKW